MLAALVLLNYSLQFIDGYWPKWTRPFVHEAKEKPSEVETPLTQQPVTGTFGLLVLATIGLTFQILNVFFPIRQPSAIYPAIAWVRNVWYNCDCRLTIIIGHRSSHRHRGAPKKSFFVAVASFHRPLTRTAGRIVS
jgi:hypothetical protein